MTAGRALAWFLFSLVFGTVLSVAMTAHNVPWWARGVVTFGIGWTIGGHIIRARRGQGKP